MNLTLKHFPCFTATGKPAGCPAPPAPVVEPVTRQCQ